MVVTVNDWAYFLAYYWIAWHSQHSNTFNKVSSFFDTTDLCLLPFMVRIKPHDGLP